MLPPTVPLSTVLTASSYSPTVNSSDCFPLQSHCQQFRLLPPSPTVNCFNCLLPQSDCQQSHQPKTTKFSGSSQSRFLFIYKCLANRLCVYILLQRDHTRQCSQHIHYVQFKPCAHLMSLAEYSSDETLFNNQAGILWIRVDNKLP